MADDKKEKKPIFNPIEWLNNSPVGGWFGGRPWILLIIAVPILAILIFLIVKGINTAARPRKATTLTDGVLKVGIVVGEDRFAYHGNNGLILGIEPTLATRLADTEGLAISLIEIGNQAEGLNMINTGQIDMAMGRYVSGSESLSGFAVSGEYGQSGLYMVSALHDYSTSLELLTGYSVGVMDNVQSTAQTLSNYNFVSARSYNSLPGLGDDIRDLKVSLGIVNERDAITLVNSYPKELQAQAITNSTMEHYVAVFASRQTAQAGLMNAEISLWLDDQTRGE